MNENTINMDQNMRPKKCLILSYKHLSTSFSTFPRPDDYSSRGIGMGMSMVWVWYEYGFA